MKKAWEITKLEFIKSTEISSHGIDFISNVEDVVRQEVMYDCETWIPNSSNCFLEHISGRFYFADVFETGSEDVALLFCPYNQEEMRIVGGYTRGNVYVEPEFRGMGLGKRLVLEAYERSGYLNPEFHPEEGLRVHEADHRQSVLEAIMHGENVPDIVLRDYPDIEIDNANLLAII